MYDTELVKEILRQILWSACDTHIEELGQTLQRMLADLEES